MGWIGDAFAALRGDDFPAAMLALLSLATVAVTGWAVLVVLMASVPALRGLAKAVTPRLLHGVLLAGLAGLANASAVHADDRGVDGLRLPDRPVVVESSTSPTTRPVVVEPGDTLWAIARRRLGSTADTASIATACGRWYRANRDVIGSDPDLIHPGQRLDPPAKDHS